MKTLVEKKLTALTLEQVDHFLEAFCVALLVPLVFIKLGKSDIYDVLTYASFVFTVWSAAFAGRGIFASKKGQADLLARGCFAGSLFFVATAAILLIPTMFRHAEWLVYACLVITCVLYSIGAIAAGLMKYHVDGRCPLLRKFVIPASLMLVDVGFVAAFFIVKP